MNKLYHKQMGLPAGAAQLWHGEFQLAYRQHAEKEAASDRLGRIDLFSSIELQAGDVVEIECEAQGCDWRPVKAVVRVPYDDVKDLVMVLNRPEAGTVVVRTQWFNSARDNHRTLDRSKYSRP